MNTVMMTGHPEVIEAMTTAGIIYLRKPFRLTELSKMIGDHLGADE